MGVKDKLKEYELVIYESEADDRCAIDFSVADKDDNIAWAWGDKDDYEVECNHAIVEYDDDETVGECIVCGATCDWHWETYGDAGYTQKERVPHDWHNEFGGLIAEYINENYKKGDYVCE